jgi:hypothetical protein
MGAGKVVVVFKISIEPKAFMAHAYDPNQVMVFEEAEISVYGIERYGGDAFSDALINHVRIGVLTGGGQFAVNLKALVGEFYIPASALLHEPLHSLLDNRFTYSHTRSANRPTKTA